MRLFLHYTTNTLLLFIIELILISSLIYFIVYMFLAASLRNDKKFSRKKGVKRYTNNVLKSVNEEQIFDK